MSDIANLNKAIEKRKTENINVKVFNNIRIKHIQKYLRKDNLNDFDKAIQEHLKSKKTEIKKNIKDKAVDEIKKNKSLIQTKVESVNKIIESIEGSLDVINVNSKKVSRITDKIKYINSIDIVLRISDSVEEKGLLKAIVTEVVAAIATKIIANVLAKAMESFFKRFQIPIDAKPLAEGIISYFKVQDKISNFITHRWNILDGTYKSENSFDEKTDTLFKKLKELVEKGDPNDENEIKDIEKEIELRKKFNKVYTKETKDETSKHIKEDWFRAYKISNMSKEELFNLELDVIGTVAQVSNNRLAKRSNISDFFKRSHISKLSEKEFRKAYTEKRKNIEELIKKKNALELYGSKEDIKKNDYKLAVAKEDYLFYREEDKNRDKQVFNSYDQDLKDKEKYDNNKIKYENNIKLNVKKVKEEIQALVGDNNRLKKYIDKYNVKGKDGSISNKRNTAEQEMLYFANKKKIEELKKVEKYLTNALNNPNSKELLKNGLDPSEYHHVFKYMRDVYKHIKAEQSKDKMISAFARRQVQKRLEKGDTYDSFKIKIDGKYKAYKLKENETRTGLIERIAKEHRVKLSNEDINEQKRNKTKIDLEKKADEVSKYFFWKSGERKQYNKIDLVNNKELTEKLYSEMNNEKLLREKSDKEFKEIDVKPEALYFKIKELLNKLEKLDTESKNHFNNKNIHLKEIYSDIKNPIKVDENGRSTLIK